MSAAEVFFDTNVLLYLLSTDTAKAHRSEALLRQRGTINVQVLDEFANVARRKLGMSWSEIRDVLGQIRMLCDVRPLTVVVHEVALDVAQRYGYSIYDALIIAAALDAQCKTLYSEDMQNSQCIDDRLTIHDPYTQAA